MRGSTSRPGRYPLGEPKDFIRYPDAVVGGVAKEAKTGFVRNSSRIRKQIEKDAELIARLEVDDIEWHIFASGRSNSIGADDAILDLLDLHGIPYIFHIP